MVYSMQQSITIFTSFPSAPITPFFVLINSGLMVLLELLSLSSMVLVCSDSFLTFSEVINFYA
jgi:hypothetical protein